MIASADGLSGTVGWEVEVVEAVVLDDILGVGSVEDVACPLRSQGFGP